MVKELDIEEHGRSVGELVSHDVKEYLRTKNVVLWIGTAPF
jgi:hypothetical protein